MKKSGFIRRAVAFIIDWVLSFAPVVLWYELSPNSYYPSVSDVPLVLGLFALGMGYLLLRDAIFGGSSIGKLITGIICRNADGSKAPFSKLFVRNLTSMLFFIDAVMLLTVKKSTGDYIAGTDVFVKARLN